MRITLRHSLLGLRLVAPALPVLAAGSGPLYDLLNKVRQPGSSASNLRSNLPNSDIASGLKEALAKGTINVINSLGRNDGFWKNARVRIPLPGKLEQGGNLARRCSVAESACGFSQ